MRPPSMRKSVLPVGLPLFMTAHAMETCFALVMVAANDWAIRCCYGVLASFSELPIFWSHYFSYAKHVSMVFCRQQQWLTNRQYTFPHGGWSHEHIDQDKQKENLLRRLLLFIEKGKQEQPTTIAVLQTRSILRQKASLYEKLQERRSRRFYLIQRGRSPFDEYNHQSIAI